MPADRSGDYEQYRELDLRDVFLPPVEQIVPCAEAHSVIEPHDLKAGIGRPPMGSERMLRITILQNWFNLADAACEDALADNTALHRFVCVDLGWERVPDASSLLNFRRFLEEHKTGEALFAKVGQVPQAQGLKVRTGTIVDATINGAPNSTKNEQRLHNPEMQQARKG